MNIGKGTPLCAKKLRPKFAGPITVSFCQPWAAMIMPTITRTTRKATSESWAGSERPNTLILTLLPVRGGSDRDVLPFLRLELTSVYGHWCSEVPRTLLVGSSVSENTPSRQLVNRGRPYLV